MLQKLDSKNKMHKKYVSIKRTIYSGAYSYVQCKIEQNNHIDTQSVMSSRHSCKSIVQTSYHIVHSQLYFVRLYDVITSAVSINNVDKLNIMSINKNNPSDISHTKPQEADSNSDNSKSTNTPRSLLPFYSPL